MQSVLFRSDAAPHIGLGHVVRSFALAQECQKQGMQPVFAFAIDSVPMREMITSEAIEVSVIDAERGGDADAKALLQLAMEKGAQWIVVDGYDFDVTYHRALRQAGRKLLVIDDHAHLDAYEADILFNQTIAMPKEAYDGKINADAEMLLGTQYALLRGIFRAFGQKPHPIADSATKILVTLGGAAPIEEVQKIVEALSLIESPSFEVLLAVGAEGTGSLSALEKRAEASSHHFTIVRHIEDMPEKMQWADMAISAGGSTNWELLYMGLPTVTGIIADNQEMISNGLGEAGLALNVGWYRDCSVEALRDSIQTLTNSQEMRAEMSRKQQEAVDGKGAARVAEVMQSLSGR